jgi:hypothetical protein
MNAITRGNGTNFLRWLIIKSMHSHNNLTSFRCFSEMQILNNYINTNLTRFLLKRNRRNHIVENFVELERIDI